MSVLVSRHEQRGPVDPRSEVATGCFSIRDWGMATSTRMRTTRTTRTGSGLTHR